MEVFIDTEQNPLVVGKKYIDHEGDELVVDCVNSGYLDVTYTTPINAWGGLVRYYADMLHLDEPTFTPIKTSCKPSETADLTKVLASRFKAAVEPSSSLPDASTGTKNDSGKLRFDLLPADSIQEVVQVITYGETKYPSVEIEGKKVQNWKVLPDNENRLFAATMRHLWQHRSGELLDQETKLKHLAHAASSLMFLINIENEKIKLKGTN